MTEAEKAYERFISRYSRHHGITPEEARQHALARETKVYYEEEYSIGGELYGNTAV